MSSILNNSDSNETSNLRAARLFAERFDENSRRTDRLFAMLLLVEWAGAVAASLLISPRTWYGAQSAVHLHVWTALLLGGALVSLPVYLALRAPGRVITRHAIAVGQMLISALLIHLTGGRIETHFHIFGSLAFLAFYRDWRVLATATIVVSLDHILRGTFWPQSVFGVLTASPWRWMEHAAWVLFETTFLVISCLQSVREMKSLASQQASLEATNASVETEVARRTDELQTAGARMSLVFEAAPCGMVMMGKDGAISMVNRRVEEMFGFERAELLDHKIEMLLPERHREQHPALRDSFFQDPQARAMGSNSHLFGARKDGSEFPLEIGLNPLVTDEGIFVLAAVVDVTERKAVERELKQYAEMMDANNTSLQRYAEEADAANRAKSEFLASMSHELRTPLNAIIGFSEGLLERVDRHPLNDHQIDRLTKVKKSGDHLLALINNVLDLAKVESGKIEVYATEFKVGPLTEEIAILVEGLLKDRSEVQFRVELEDPGALVVSDRDKIKQVLINLVGNATKFTQQGHITLRVENDDSYVRMSVEDSGVGIPDDQLPKIFDKFHQVDQAQHRSIKGTGLGLALCKSFAGLLGGVLTVRSIEARGSVFTMCIPQEFDSQGHQQQVELENEIKDRCRRAHSPDKCLKILCIEDNPTNMDVLMDYLEKENIHVLPAFNGNSGLKLAHEEHPDAITLDVMMPGLDGWEVLRRLKAEPATRDIPVIMTTAIDDKVMALNLGADDLLLKPISGDSLTMSLGRLTANHGHQARTLAIVDDDPDIREIIAESLEDEGFEIRLYESGEHFLAAVKADRPDIVVTDLMMPGVDGFGVLETLRSDPETIDIPVIVMTAKMLSGTDMKQLNGRIRAVIEKNGLSRDQALGQLIDQLDSLKHELVTK